MTTQRLKRLEVYLLFHALFEAFIAEVALALATHRGVVHHKFAFLAAHDLHVKLGGISNFAQLIPFVALGGPIAAASKRRH